MSDPYPPYPPQPPGGSPATPYGMPYPYYPQAGASHAPAGRSPSAQSKAASVVMALLALGALLLGGLFILLGAVISPDLIAQAQADGAIPPDVNELAAETNMSVAGLFRIYFYVFGGLLVAYALLIGILSPFVWGSRLFAVILSMIAIGIVALLAGLMGIGSLVSGSIGGVVFMLLVLGVHLALLVLLGFALRTGRGPTPPGYSAAGAVGSHDIGQQQAAWRAYYEQSGQPPRDPNA